uniref:Phosphatidylinositol transfer protein cytoplasmic 1b n=1 Tax=Oryzias latipes TaxID=8090 RepID=A0A3P9KD22_ORYLA
MWIGQLYMISKHCCEQSDGGEGVEVVRNEPDMHPEHGAGQLTEKRIYLSSKLPSWAKAFVPRIFYVTEKAWNFYPYTITGFIRIETRFEDNNGNNDRVFGDAPTPAENVSFLDILSDPIPEKHYKESEDLSRWRSSKTNRGPLEIGWKDHHKPIMCSYKRVHCSFEVYGFQTRTEDFVHRSIKDILLVAHRQAVAWLDEWHGWSKIHHNFINENKKDFPQVPSRPGFFRSFSVTDEQSLKKRGMTTAASSASSVPHVTGRHNSTPE